jgi:threonine/homoserine/homoserine lactone efflux protein
MITYLLQGFFLGFPAVATPGPLQAFYLSQTMQAGWRRTLPSALAPLLSDGPIIILVLLVITRIPDDFLRILRIAGGLFVLYLAFSAFKHFRNDPEPEVVNSSTSSNGLLMATLTNLLNPNPYIFWGVVAGPILIEAWRESSVHGAMFMAGFYGTMISGFAVMIIFFATVGHLSSRLVRLLTGLSALALLVFGIYQLWSGIKG